MTHEQEARELLEKAEKAGRPTVYMGQEYVKKQDAIRAVEYALQQREAALQTAADEITLRDAQIELLKRSAVAAGAGWQPIETYPNDGTMALFYSPGKKRAHNENAAEPYMRVDTIGERWPRGKHQYPEAPYTHWQIVDAPAPPLNHTKEA